MKAFYCDVTIVGTALVYANSADEATAMLDDAGVMVAGNKMLGFTVQKDGGMRETYWLRNDIRNDVFVPVETVAMEDVVPPCRCGHPNCGWCA